LKIELEPLRGMRDITEPDSKYVDYLLENFKRVAELYGYEYVIPPTLERFKLFSIKSGPEIERSMYVFKDKAGREVCLRPEFTAGIARIYLKHYIAKPKPVKLYYIGQVFRYEEPQYGRYREFIQAGVEYIGDSSEYADIEQIILLRDFYKSIGLNDYKVKIGTIAIIRKLLTLWGIPEREQDLIIHYIDKKMVDRVRNLLANYEGSKWDLLEELMGFSTSDPDKLLDFGLSIGLNKVDPTIMHELSRIAKILNIVRKLGVENCYVDLGFARGLAYYTGFIFEIIIPKFSLSIAGGGRYDKLIELYGGPPTPATGFSIGVDRTILALKELNILPKPRLKKLMLIVTVNDYLIADTVASKLRSSNYSVLVRFTSQGRIGDSIGLASRKGFDYVGIIGEKEISKGVVTIKNLRTREQRAIPVDELSNGIPF